MVPGGRANLFCPDLPTLNAGPSGTPCRRSLPPCSSRLYALAPAVECAGQTFTSRALVEPGAPLSGGLHVGRAMQAAESNDAQPGRTKSRPRHVRDAAACRIPLILCRMDIEHDRATTHDLGGAIRAILPSLERRRVSGGTLFWRSWRIWWWPTGCGSATLASRDGSRRCRPT